MASTGAKTVARSGAHQGLLLDQEHVPRPQVEGGGERGPQQVVDLGRRRRERGPRLDLGRVHEAGDARPVVVGAQDPEHGRAVLLRLEGPEPTRRQDRRGEPPVAELLVGAAPLVLDVGDAHVRSRGRIGDAEPGAVVLEARQVRRDRRRIQDGPALGGRRPAHRGRRGRCIDHRLDPRPRVEAARDAAGVGRAGGVDPVDAAQLGKAAPHPALEPGQRGRGQGRAGVRAQGGRVGGRGRHEHRGRGGRGGGGRRRDGQRHRRGDDEAASEHGTRMAVRSPEAKLPGA